MAVPVGMAVAVAVDCVVGEKLFDKKLSFQKILTYITHFTGALRCRRSPFCKHENGFEK